MPGKCNVIVIGSGAGGLTATSYLAKYGFRVLVLEQAGHLGGYLNPFQRGSYHFNPGVHYIGQCRPGQIVYELLAGLELDASELFCEMDPEGFDVYRFPDMEVRMCRGLDAYRERLAGLFPHEVRGLDRFFRVLREVGEFMEAVDRLIGRGEKLAAVELLVKMRSVIRWRNATYASLLEWVTDDPRLRAVLAGLWGDYGLPPSRASALFALITFHHYTDGAFFPRGGSSTLKDALISRASENGAEFRCDSRVERIVVNNGEVVAVELVSGERIECDLVVADVNPTVVYGQLIGPESLPDRIRRQVTRTIPSGSAFWVFLGMQRDLQSYGLGAFNIWDYPSWDIDAMVEPAFQGRIPDQHILFISPNSLKDDTHALAPEGGTSLEVVVGMPYEPFAHWAGKSAAQRGQEYETFKEEIGNQIMTQLDARWPGLIGDIEVKEFATPVTASFFAGAPRGSIYGPAVIPDQVGLRRFRTRSPIPNLYLAGSGVFGDGVAACMGSGRLAAQLIRHDFEC
jgi:all-trans-retinol 13,14-reductase